MHVSHCGTSAVDSVAKDSNVKPQLSSFILECAGDGQSVSVEEERKVTERRVDGENFVISVSYSIEQEQNMLSNHWCFCHITHYVILDRQKKMKMLSHFVTLNCHFKKREAALDVRILPV